ncbi:PE-PGRS family protein [Mycobacterium ulcerans]
MLIGNGGNVGTGTPGAGGSGGVLLGDEGLNGSP